MTQLVAEAVRVTSPDDQQVYAAADPFVGAAGGQYAAVIVTEAIIDSLPDFTAYTLYVWTHVVPQTRYVSTANQLAKVVVHSLTV